jgi:hypothetical protein
MTHHQPNVHEDHGHVHGPDCGHGADHEHGPGCGHETVPHDDHVDFLVDGRLHRPHEDHCDDHGPLPLA